MASAINFYSGLHFTFISLSHIKKNCNNSCKSEKQVSTKSYSSHVEENFPPQQSCQWELKIDMRWKLFFLYFFFHSDTKTSPCRLIEKRSEWEASCEDIKTGLNSMLQSFKTKKNHDLTKSWKFCKFYIPWRWVRWILWWTMTRLWS